MPYKKELALNYFNRLWNNKDLTVIDEFIDKDCILYSLLGDFQGPDEMKRVVLAWLNSFPDIKVKSTMILSESDVVMLQWQAHGTHKGVFKGIEGSGKIAAYTGVTLYRIVNHKIVEYWAYVDTHHIIKQIT